MNARRDIQQEITDRILDLMSDERSWNHFLANAPRSAGAPYNAKSKRAYNGVNVLQLWATAMERGYEQSAWVTFKQAKELGGSVKRGEKGTGIIFWKFLEDKKDPTKKIPMAKAYTVFNVEQCEGLERFHVQRAEPVEGEAFEANEMLEAFVAAQSATLHHEGSRAFYQPSADRIVVPEADKFASSVGYYGTLAHELVHWTSHEERANRQLGKRFGDDAYAFEELVAELGAAFISAEFGLDLSHSRDGIENHASYLKSWSKRMKDDKKAIITAASKASAAVGWLHQNIAADEQLEAA